MSYKIAGISNNLKPGFFLCICFPLLVVSPYCLLYVWFRIYVKKQKRNQIGHHASPHRGFGFNVTLYTTFRALSRCSVKCQKAKRALVLCISCTLPRTYRWRFCLTNLKRNCKLWSLKPKGLLRWKGQTSTNALSLGCLVKTYRCVSIMPLPSAYFQSNLHLNPRNIYESFFQFLHSSMFYPISAYIALQAALDKANQVSSPAATVDAVDNTPSKKGKTMPTKVRFTSPSVYVQHRHASCSISFKSINIHGPTLYLYITKC